MNIPNKLFEAIRDLAKANYLTGVWDNRRFQLCKKEFTSFTEEDKSYLYKTEKNSRYNVEQRAVNRSVIDKCFKILVEGKPI